MAAGAVIKAAEVAYLEKRRVVTVVRPYRHHAGMGGRTYLPGQSSDHMGFCFINNIMVAAAHVRSLYGKRVAVVDIDHHAGHGTQEIMLNVLGYIF